MIKKLFALACALAVLTSVAGTANAVAEASDYLISYSAWMTAGDDSGEVYISFDVEGTHVMDEIGCDTIELQEKNGTQWLPIWYKSGNVSNGLVAEDEDFHWDDVLYSRATSGKQYRAKVTIFAADSEGSDGRIVTTNTVTAP